MVGEFEQHEANRQAKAREQDRADYTAELNGVGGDNGRITRYNLETKQQRIERKERDKQALSYAAKVSAAYAKLYDDTLQNLRDARNAVYEAQLLASAELEQAQKLYQEALDNAARLPDGTAVFMDKTGTVYTQDGVLLEGDILDEILWKDNSTSREVMQERGSALKDKQDRKDRMDIHDVRLHEIEDTIDKLRGHDTPENTKLMIELNQEMEAIKEDAQQVNKLDLQVDNTLSKQVVSAPLDLKGFDM